MKIVLSLGSPRWLDAVQLINSSDSMFADDSKLGKRNCAHKAHIFKSVYFLSCLMVCSALSLQVLSSPQGDRPSPFLLLLMNDLTCSSESSCPCWLPVATIPSFHSCLAVFNSRPVVEGGSFCPACVPKTMTTVSHPVGVQQLLAPG